MQFYSFIMGSKDKRNWVQLTGRIMPSETLHFDPPLDHLWPYLKLVKQEGRIRRGLHIQNDNYWQIKHGHSCPTCGQLVLGSVEPRREN